MPTGYTADIKDGISFKTFAMNCARAFGACVMLRDEGGGGEKIPEKFEPSDYHKNALETAQAELAALLSMSDKDKQRAADKAFDDAETNRLMYLKSQNEQEAAYRAMLAKVHEWTPPTADHEGLKAFMAEQIESSIRFDCGDYYKKPTEHLTGAAWAAKRRHELDRSIARHTEEHAQEVERANSRTEWVRQLRQAL